MRSIAPLLLISFIIVIFVPRLYGQASEWSDDGLGWVLRKQGNNPPKRFFAIGVFGVPGYYQTDKATTDNLAQINAFQTEAANFNLYYLNRFAERRTHFKNKVLLSGWSSIKYQLKNLNGSYTYDSIGNQKTVGPFSLNDVVGGVNGNFITFSEMKKIRQHPQFFKSTILENSLISNFKSAFLPSTTLSDTSNYDAMWYLYDEPDNGGEGTGWVMAPESLEVYKKTVAEHAPSTLTFTCLFGHIKGDMHFWEKANPNDETLATDHSIPYAANMQRLYDGSVPPAHPTDAQYYQNVHDAALDYTNSSTILSVNTYQEFNLKPSLAGLTVKAIKDACGISKPVWLCFEGHNKRKPADFVPTDYALNLRAQVYSAIINGASGVLFYNTFLPAIKDSINTTWRDVKLLAGELQQNASIITAQTDDVSIDGPVQFIIKHLENGERWAITMNTDPASPHTFHYPNFHDKILAPNEVFIARESYPESLNPLKILGLFSNDRDGASLNFEDKCGNHITLPPEAIVLFRPETDFSPAVLKNVANGDFNGDGLQDVVMLYKQNTSQHKIIVMISDGKGGFTDRWGRTEETTEGFNVPLSCYWVRLPQTNFDIDKVKYMTTGDFDGNGKDDLVLFYDQDADNQRIIVLQSNGVGFFNQLGTAENSPNFVFDATWLNKPKTIFNIDAQKFAATGNFDAHETGVVKDDLVFLYKQNSQQHKIIILCSTGTTFVDMWGRNESNSKNPYVMPLDAKWTNKPSSVFNIDNVKFMTTGNFDGTGKDDLVLFYHDIYGGADNHKIIILHSDGYAFHDRNNNIDNSTTFINNAYWLTRLPAAWTLDVVTNVATGNFDGVNFDDLVFQYKQNSNQHKTIILQSDSAGHNFMDRIGRDENSVDVNIPLNCDWLNNNSVDFNLDDVRWLMAGRFNKGNFSDLFMITASSSANGARADDQETTMVEEDLSDAPYPNPTTGSIVIPLQSSGCHPKNIELFNAAGIRIADHSVAGELKEYTLDMSTFPDGLYIVRVASHDKLTTHKVIKSFAPKTD